MLAPNPWILGREPYSVPMATAPIDLDLSGNLGEPPDPTLLEALLPRAAELMGRYPDAGPLEAKIATRLGLEPAQVLVTAGGDDALDRACRAMLRPDRNVVFPEPGFLMTERYAELAGGELRRPLWAGERYPTDAVLAAADAHTRMVVVTSPNNPTGGVATVEDLQRISQALPEAMLLVDLAYTEYAEEDLSAAALALPNAVIVRSFSKAWGLAGLRVGFVAGPAEVIGWLRAVGAPYAIAGLSLALVEARLEQAEPDPAGSRVERAAVEQTLASLGALSARSQGNFAFAEVPDPVWARDAMAGLGIGVRAFPGTPGLERALRLGLPADAAALARTQAALRAVLAPQALLFDMDGVLADVSRSYRAAIQATAAHFGVTVTAADISAAKAEGDANNDWVLTRRLLARAGVEVELAEVTEAFEALYQGTPEAPGLRAQETLLVPRAWLEGLGLPLAIVTGRPRSDAERFLVEQGIAELFPVVVCMEDAPLKPDPAPVRLALAQLGVEAAWMIGDTPDDLRAARAAGVVPLGVCAPGEADPAPLLAAGAARVLSPLTALQELLP
ncbi:MAG: TIGR01548 family HAD-type hydrolase [Alphaproteobacteria bacterium]|nr:TIGR01548 family HAD-type hydrolase [Alphaproteobacteria bacterium]MCB9791470.1 TIGR01548 family HAD-type hydrolase [Alphaproteobacteria bacterium]